MGSYSREESQQLDLALFLLERGDDKNMRIVRMMKVKTEYPDLEQNGFCEALEALNIPYKFGIDGVLFYIELMQYKQTIDELCKLLGVTREDFNKIVCS